MKNKVSYFRKLLCFIGIHFYNCVHINHDFQTNVVKSWRECKFCGHLSNDKNGNEK